VSSVGEMNTYRCEVIANASRLTITVEAENSLNAAELAADRMWCSIEGTVQPRKVVVISPNGNTLCYKLDSALRLAFRAELVEASQP
jgi:hypothetical protein